MNLAAFSKLATSSKALVLICVVAIVAVLVYQGAITPQEFLAFLEFVVPAWMLAHAGETGAKAIADRSPR